MKKPNLLWCVLFAIFCFASFSTSKIMAHEKIYTSADRIVLLPEGLFHLNSNFEWEEVSLIGRDSTGIYALPDGFYKCPACGKISGSDTCSNSRCELYGK